MRLGEIRIGGKRGFVLHARAGRIAVIDQQIAEIDAPDGIAGMVRHGLRIGRAGGGAKAAFIGERAELVQRGEMRGVAVQDVDIGLRRRGILACRGERSRVRKQRCDCVRG